MKEIPDIAKTGILIDPADPQPEVRKNAETARDWEYSEEAAYLYRMAVVFKNRFLDPILLTDRRRLPDPVISFCKLEKQEHAGGIYPGQESTGSFIRNHDEHRTLCG